MPRFLGRIDWNQARAKGRRLCLGWAIWSCLVFLLLLCIWLWQGAPEGPESPARTWGLMIGISLLTPPIVWIIGKTVIG